MSNRPKIRPTGIKWPAPRDRSVKVTIDGIDVSRYLRDVTFDPDSWIDEAGMYRSRRYPGRAA